MLPGMSLEAVGNGGRRGMNTAPATGHRTRLTAPLPSERALRGSNVRRTGNGVVGGRLVGARGRFEANGSGGEPSLRGQSVARPWKAIWSTWRASVAAFTRQVGPLPTITPKESRRPSASALPTNQV